MLGNGRASVRDGPVQNHAGSTVVPGPLHNGWVGAMPCACPAVDPAIVSIAVVGAMPCACPAADPGPLHNGWVGAMPCACPAAKLDAINRVPTNIRLHNGWVGAMPCACP